MFYLASDYCATGEGHTVCLMITRAHPSYDDDYETPPRIKNKVYEPGKLKEGGPEGVAKRRFIREFGDWLGHGIQFMEKDDFMTTWNNHLPLALIEHLKKGNFPPGFEWHSQFHVNYS